MNALPSHQLAKMNGAGVDDDGDDDFRLPIDHRITQTLDRDIYDRAMTATQRPIEDTNVGHRLLQKFGWKPGQGLGRAGQGRVEPVSMQMKLDAMGVGKKEQDQELVDDATSHRRLLMSEMTVTAEREQKWKQKVDREESIQKELKRVNEVFYCKDCNKQYINVKDWTAHMSSYDHHHRVRMEETRIRERDRNLSGVAERDIRRAEKEFNRINELAQARVEKGTDEYGAVAKPTKAAALLEQGAFSFGGNATKKGLGGRKLGKLGKSKVGKPGLLKKTAAFAGNEDDEEEQQAADVAAQLLASRKRPLSFRPS